MTSLRSLLLSLMVLALASLAPTRASAQTYARAYVVVSPPSHDARISTELSIGALAGVVGMVGGGLVGWFAEDAIVGPCLRDECSVGPTGMVLGAYGGALLAAPLGVALAGAAWGADGDLGAAYIGELIAAAIGAIPTSILLWAAQEPGLTQDERDGYVGGALVCALLFPLAGAAIGYELSIAQAKMGEVALLPALNVGPDGATFGMSGSF